MNYINDINTYSADGVNAFVEICVGTNVKYELDITGKYLTVVRELNQRFKYPFSYGFIPQTVGGDNDPLDAVILGSSLYLPMTTVGCRVLGVLKTEDNNEQDDKIFLIPGFIRTTKRQEKKLIKQAINFLNKYKYPNQKSTKNLGYFDEEEAKNIIEKARAKFLGTEPKAVSEDVKKIDTF